VGRNGVMGTIVLLDMEKAILILKMAVILTTMVAKENGRR
jgi:hypothetical protein